MSADLKCYHCGASLADLTPPISRRDQCPSCFVYLHVCRMCVNYDPQVPGQCREDGAEEVIEKERPNFCDWYGPTADAYDGDRAVGDEQAKSELAALFDDAEGDKADSDLHSQEAEDLFK